MDRDPFQKYLKESEPDKLTRGYAWSTAIGLQAVDGLRPSEYLINTAVQNIEGEITLQEVKYLIDNYYQNRPVRSDEERTEEADKVSKLLGLQNSSVSKLLSKLSKADIIEPMPGCGKGKYRFSRK